MKQPQQVGDPRNLWERVERQAELAICEGALHHIDTDARTVEDAGVEFVVRRATQLKKKEAAAGDRSQLDAGCALSPNDPFAYPEPALFVGNLSPTHFALLNKYNVLDRHLLVITRNDIDQDTPLDAADFEALSMCMADAPVLGFYNGGAAAGASQRHKHLQVVRLPLAPGARAIPVESLLGEASATIPRLPFRHAFVRADARDPQSLFARYREMRETLALEAGPYNLVVARDWMLTVPRSRASFGTIPVNSLAFAGALFVRDDAELRTVERLGPMAVLRGVAFPKDPS